MNHQDARRVLQKRDFETGFEIEKQKTYG